MKKVIDIKKIYDDEIREIHDKLQQLEEYRYYEKTNVRSDGYLSTNIIQLRKMIDDLINKIEFEKESDESKTDEIFTISKD